MDNSRLPVDKPGALGQVGCYKGNTGRLRRAEPVHNLWISLRGHLSVLSVRCCPFIHPYEVSVDKPHNVLLIKDSCDS